MKLPKELKEKRDLTGKTKKCSVGGCGEVAIRSLSENKWSKVCEKAGLKIAENEVRLRKILLCKKHYKAANKVRKEDEKLIQKKGFLEDSAALKKGRWEGM
jgi:hypothetical protein